MPKKSLGQHFLSDPRILARIAEALTPVAGETVLEIGPGRGTLTAALATRVTRLIAIEKDGELVPGLRASFPAAEIVEGDALELDWHALAGPGPRSVIGNIPYYITSPLIDKALTPPRPRTIVFLVQKEVADRVAAPREGRSMGRSASACSPSPGSNAFSECPPGRYIHRPRWILQFSVSPPWPPR